MKKACLWVELASQSYMEIFHRPYMICNPHMLQMEMAGDKSQKAHAPIQWAQRNDKLYVTINVEDCKNPNIALEPDKLIFSGRGGSENKDYEAIVEFYQEIIPKESKYAVLARNIPMSLKKKSDGYWPRLLKEKVKVHWLKTDFDKWRDEDDSDIDETQDMAFEDMMKQMGDINTSDSKIPPPEDEEEDSDDEELPDLES